MGLHWMQTDVTDQLVQLEDLTGLEETNESRSHQCRCHWRRTGTGPQSLLTLLCKLLLAASLQPSSTSSSSAGCSSQQTNKKVVFFSCSLNFTFASVEWNLYSSWYKEMKVEDMETICSGAFLRGLALASGIWQRNAWKRRCFWWCCCCCWLVRCSSHHQQYFSRRSSSNIKRQLD